MPASRPLSGATARARVARRCRRAPREPATRRATSDGSLCLSFRRPSLVGAQAVLEAVEGDERLGVGGLGQDGVEIGERAQLDVDALVLLDLGAFVDVGDAG